MFGPILTEVVRNDTATYTVVAKYNRKIRGFEWHVYAGESTDKRLETSASNWMSPQGALDCGIDYVREYLP